MRIFQLCYRNSDPNLLKDFARLGRVARAAWIMDRGGEQPI